jgi:hypothetical protein
MAISRASLVLSFILFMVLELRFPSWPLTTVYRSLEALYPVERAVRLRPCAANASSSLKRNEQPESLRKQIHDTVTEEDSRVDDEELRKRQDYPNTLGPAVSIETDIEGV